ncbi:hypothetical protein RIF29_21204 [Crotalaria pallida]|uniref:Uncharacterized protein n=1 Tax=Crotalaria pallida TaxID=3830 RepID=A0AAN9F4W1_CROPI
MTSTNNFRDLNDDFLESDALVLCRIFEKSGAGPKNGEKYGAPLIEEEWEYDEVAPLPNAGEEASNEVNAVGPIAFLETDDLEKKLDMVAEIGNAGHPSNFYPGECSSNPHHSQEPIKDQKPLEGELGISEPQNRQLSDSAEQYNVDAFPVEDGIGGDLDNIESAINFDFTFEDLELYLDAADYPLINDTESFLETKDLASPCEGNPTEADPSGVAMVEEFLSYSDDDISKYLSFDSPLSGESENPIPEQNPLIQQNVEGDANAISMSSKHDFGAPSGDEASSKQNPQPLSGNTRPFVKKANEWLASIPAPPAFASEFPPKSIALGLHSAAQSSSSDHVTAGMVSTDITLRGNLMGCMVGKNGLFNAIISTAEVSQSDAYSAAFIPVLGLLSSRSAFALSRDWVFLMMMLFPLLILSLVCKFGSFMSAK